MLYRMLRNLMFRLDAEKAHHLGLTGLSIMEMTGLSSLLYKKVAATPVRVMGLTFPNAVGLAAGLDKNGDYIEAMSALGFGFVEIGTVTPRPQPGNPKPRLFRIPEAQAIINRMGFNNLGVDHLIEQVKVAETHSLIGINIGKNFDTPVENAADDYLIGLNKVYPYADYVTINISSPNTPGLRSLQFGESLDTLLAALKKQQTQLAEQYNRYVPMAVKVAPDLTAEEVLQLADAFARHQVDAVIATNTTMSRQGVEGLPNANEAGGLSGAPVLVKSTEIVRQFRLALPEHLPIIAAGGIMSAEDAIEKIDAGASLVQIYSGLIYRGPALIREIIKAIEKRN
ncbi:quinone-dependent dihydroorotate dehydrogenase [Methylophaga sp. OBS4]|uniref:quinone-dependent dihydroorotate dehydrogenase n=1 Tax=Methylophaga sp. OBS4 TaxID=2991935 RepID=UPI00224E791C|nr:quinone-dependent dihydroorotate dehydrogenase [Methylophaga sp. OBS4]MCX4188489.1 quinone-dependent dihydroorotate dehydrogenase [Methylophaga sp. OBS4]